MRFTLLCIITALTISTLPAAIEVNDKTEINLSAFVPCAAGGAGEMVDLRGPLHTILSLTINDNNISGFFHFQQDVTGTGETTGAKYKATGLMEENFSTALPKYGGQVHFTFVNNYRVVGQGSGDNFLFHETSHLTVNANGTVTVVHDNFSVDCK